MKGRVLIIAGSDPSGGAGIQADIKTVTALGGYAATAITALTVQNTTGVSAVHPVSPDIIRDQIDAVMSDIGADAIKIGMIGNVETAQAILTTLENSGWDYQGGCPDAGPVLILDPVLVATSGDSLASNGVAEFIREKLLPKTYLVTPNLPEAEALTGMEITNGEGQRLAGEKLLEMGVETVLIKGGHDKQEIIKDVLVTHAGTQVFQTPRIDTKSTHGTGCTLASAIATGLAQSMPLSASAERAIDYVHQAIKSAPGFGAGHGPLNHAHPLEVEGGQ
ncbi:MAG: hydroxymethylpyrimidine/phosphomethylpyrimidine kinase [Hyphococcus sp.]|nr:MAG: hydroxymethylpyrimidine/phosphomethylpyrimidine kinase [Marinicaulis sp.]